MQSIVAPTYIGSSGSSRYSSSRAHEAEDMQQRVVPADLSSVSSSAYRQSHVSEHDEDDLQNTVVPVYKPVYNSRVYSQSRGGSAAESSRTGSVVPAYVSGGSTQTQSHRSLQSESELSESRKPVPVGQYVSISARPGSSNVLAVPVRVINTQGVPDDTQKYHSRTSEYSSGSDTSSQTRSQNPTSTTYRVVYNPSRNYVSSDKIASTSDSENSRTYGSVQQPEKLTSYNSYSPDVSSSSQSRFHSEDSASNSEQVRVAPVTVSYPINGGSSRFATGTSSVQQGNTHSRAPVFPINTIESSSSSRTAEERDQRRYTPASPTYISSSRNSELEESRNQASSSSRPSYVGVGRTASGSDQQSSSQYGSRGSTYFLPAGSRTQTQTQQQSGSNTQYQQQSGSNTQPQQSGSGLSTQNQRQGVYNYSPYTPSRTSGSHATDRSSSRFDSSRTDDLSSFMTEAERKARLQQQQISGSSSNSANSNSEANRRTIQTASNLDSAAANFVRTSNLANRNSEIDSANIDGAGAGAGAGGYSRVRSWNKQSKWSSGEDNTRN